MNFFRHALVALVAVLALARVAAADDVPTTMSFVARLANAGVPVTGSHDFQLDLFDAASGGTSHWTETHAGVVVPSDGVLFLQLGTTVPLDSTVFAGGTQLFLQITIDGVASDSRIVVGSAPYAVHASTCATATTATTATTANNATLLASHAVTDFQLRIATGCPTGSTIESVNADGSVACETDANTTYTAGGGLLLAGTTFSVDTTAIQARVGGTCASGKYVQAINGDGSVACGVDANTVFTAGTGLVLTGTAFSVNESTIQARVAGFCAAGQAVSTVNGDGTVVCESNIENQNASAQTASVFVSGTVRTSGFLRSGSESGTTDAPTVNLTDYDGVVHRRMVSSTTAVGSVIAKTDVLELTRGTTATALNATFPTSPLGVAASIDCWGVTTTGATVAASISLSPSDNCGTPPCSQPLFATASNINGLTCMIGSTGHTTEVTMHRSGTVWTGFITSDLVQ